MCKITNQELRKDAVRMLAGVVTSHLRNRNINHSIQCFGDVYYFHLECQSLTSLEIERIHNLVKGFSANYRLESVDNFLCLAIYF